MTFTDDHPGNPLGPDTPMGRTLRVDSESHRGAWMRILMADPCAYCPHPSVTIDHVVPRDPLVPAPGLGGKHSWLNYVGACQRCNELKSNKPLLVFLAGRRGLPAGRAR